MGNEANEFTEQVYNTLMIRDYSVHIDNSGDNFNRKIRNAQIEAYNYIGVIGKEEVNSGTVNLRKRDEEKEIGKFTVSEIINLFESLKPPKSKKREEMEKLGLKI
jgi:threonyl-tRNA synthetase